MIITKDRGLVRYGDMSTKDFLLPLMILWILLYLLRNKRLFGFKPSIIVLITGLVILYTGVSALPANNTFTTEYSYNLCINKAAFFSERSVSHFTDDEPVVDIYASNYYDDPEGRNSGIEIRKYH